MSDNDKALITQLKDALSSQKGEEQDDGLQKKVDILESQVKMYQEWEKDILLNTAGEVDHLKETLISGIRKYMDPFKIKMLYGYAFGIGETPEMQQLTQLGLMFHKHQDQTKRKFRQVYAIIIGIMVGIAAGLELPEMIRIAMEAWKVIWG